MKVIDLLNKIANGEEVPKKIRIKGVYHRDFDENDCPIDVEDEYIWELDESYRDEKDYYCGEKDLFQTYLINRILNNEIEVLEDKKDKEIEIYVNGEKIDITDIYEPLKQGEYFYKENGKWYVHKLKNVSKIIEEDKKIEMLELSNATINEQKIEFKINEIIDVINKGDSNV